MSCLVHVVALCVSVTHCAWFDRKTIFFFQCFFLLFSANLATFLLCTLFSYLLCSFELKRMHFTLFFTCCHCRLTCLFALIMPIAKLIDRSQNQFSQATREKLIVFFCLLLSIKENLCKRVNEYVIEDTACHQIGHWFVKAIFISTFNRW